jgi:acetate kinase
MPEQAVLVVNAGSSSVKFAVYDAADPTDPRLELRGQIEGIADDPRFLVEDAAGRVVEDGRPALAGGGHAAAIGVLISWIFDHVGRDRLVAVGHRVVHGGGVFEQPTHADAKVIEALDGLARLAPLHQPHNVAGLRAIAEAAPGLAQVACFDTAFHRTIPKTARTLALPRELREEGLRRYGFHGLSYAHIARLLPDVLPKAARGRVVVAHLGAGASLCALRDGVSVDTTMSFSALDGLVMATRGGALDPGVPLYLMREKGYDLDRLEALLYRRSGLLGLSGASADMRALLASDDPDARLAVDVFVHRLVREIGAMAAVLGGLDALVFTAGIGERSPAIRARACAGLAWLGLALDADANASSERVVSAPGSAVAALVLPTDEERVIARETIALARP